MTVLVLASLLLAPAASVSAQDPQPPAPPVDPAMLPETQDSELEALGLIQRDGFWVNEGGMLLEPDEERIEAQASYSKADKFGYRYQKVTPGWINAYGEGDRLEGEDFAYFDLDLPFTFSFYGHDYTSLKVSEYGYLTFSNEEPKQKVSQLADATQPNSIIAPYWAALSSSDGVYQISGGDAPNRWIAVEWPNLYEPAYEGSSYTFEVVLYESGEIWFQYEAMQYSLEGYRCGTAGIEDPSGRTALVTSAYCKKIVSNTAVRIVPPSPSARVSIEPIISGGLGVPGGVIEHRVRVDNTGDKGIDVYDLSLSSKWPGILYAADGITPLTDTDGDKKIDTGPVEESTGVTVVVKITIPFKYKVGNRSDSVLKFTSSVNRKKTASIKLENAVSADFVQTYGLDRQAYMLRVSQAGLTTQEPADELFSDANPSVVETTSGRLVRSWIGNRCLDGDCSSTATELYYGIYEHDGTQVGETHILEDLSAHTSYLHEAAVSTAAGPEGSVGFAYVKVSPTDDGSTIYNLYYAAIDADGAVLITPTSVTQNDIPIYDPFEDRNSGPRFDRPNLSYTADEHIIFSWERSTSPGGPALDDIYMAVMDEDGTFIQTPRKLTNDTGDASGYHSPTLTYLMGNKALIAWSGWLRSGTTKYTYKYSIQYAVVDSLGTTFKQSSIKTGINAAGIDAAQMTGGEIVLAWTSGITNKTYVYYAIISGKSYTKTKGPISLKHSEAFKGEKGVSITTDTLNHAILTWTGANNNNLYYALLGKNGTVLTKPLLYLRTPAQSWVEISSSGNGNTTYYGTPRPVTVTLTATVPSTTNATAKTVYLAGNFNDWDPEATPMTRVDKTHWKITLVVNEKYPMLYKYTLGDWESVEKGKKCVEINDRVLDVQYGTTGTMKKSDTVSLWRNILPCTGD